MPQAKQVEEIYKFLINAKDKPIRQADVQVHLIWSKAVNYLKLAEGLLKISTEPEIKEALGYASDTTFFDWAVVCA